MPDHVHLLLRFPPDIAPAVLARELKARSSKWIHDTFPKMRSFKWQRGYGGFTVSASQVPKTKTYIHNQVKHHVKMTFEQEFLAMLDKNDVDYDRRYVFE
jgi:REP element-mobilizing transposase RayT